MCREDEKKSKERKTGWEVYGRTARRPYTNEDKRDWIILS
jgi:hypothetical protein